MSKDPFSGRQERIAALKAALSERILVLDGAAGTFIQAYALDEGGYRGARFADWTSDVRGNNDLLILSRPEIVAEMHRAYLAAGAFNSKHVTPETIGVWQDQCRLMMGVPGLRGTHSELLQQDNVYAHMWDLQQQERVKDTTSDAGEPALSGI